jgi:drug/metabolite transporter (DMT)-like permease
LALAGVLLVSQVVGLALVATFVAARGEGPPPSEAVLYAALGGVAGTIGIAAFYRGLAVGAMGIVAPISGLAAAIPVVVGVAGGERPSALQLAGIALALAGVGLASREQPAAGAGGRVAGGVGLALVAALGFGGFFVCIDQASDADAAWAILTAKSVAVAIVAGATVVIRPTFAPGPSDLRDLVAIGVFDMAGQMLYALATTEGLLSVVAVLASLYPVTTIVLARVVLGERVAALQRAGAVAALAGVALITGG